MPRSKTGLRLAIFANVLDPSPAAATLHPWEWPSCPWSRLHLDFAGPFCNLMFLVLIDAHSKWIDVLPMQSITSEKMIEKLRPIFATHGLPQKVVTDNGPSFTSKEFMSENGISHITTAPYHPSSNGLAERAVQTFKQGLKRTPGATIQERLSKFLFTYRITPQTTTGIPPATLLMGRRLRSRLDHLFPDPSQHVENKQLKQAHQHDTTKPLRTFEVSDSLCERFLHHPSYMDTWKDFQGYWSFVLPSGAIFWTSGTTTCGCDTTPGHSHSPTTCS